MAAILQQEMRRGKPINIYLNLSIDLRHQLLSLKFVEQYQNYKIRDHLKGQ